MFDYLYEWLQNLAFYMILMTAVLQALPDNSYQKYIRFFCGMILVVLLAGPVMQLFGAQEHFTEHYRTAELERTKKEMRDAAKYLEDAEARYRETVERYQEKEGER